MKNILLPAALATLALSGSAHATAYSFANLSAGNITATFTPTATLGSGSIVSQNAASLNGSGPSFNATMLIPGTVSAADAHVGTAPSSTSFSPLMFGPSGARGDSTLTAAASSSFNTVAEGAASGVNFVSGSGRVGASFAFTTTAPSSSLVISLDTMRVFNLMTDFAGESALARTTLTFTLTGADGSLLNPSVTLSNPMCDPNASPSVTGVGGKFMDSCTGTDVFTFATILPGSFTLTFQASSNVDDRSSTSPVPEPGALGIVGIGLIGLALRRRA